jgi:type VI protein secretion system component Hcp
MSFIILKINAMRKVIYVLFAAVFTFTCGNTFSQTSVVMKALDGTTKLNGGSTVPGHVNEIDILSNSQGEDFCSTCAKPGISDFSFMIVLSPAVISFKKLLFIGKKLTSIDVTYIRGGTTPVTFYKIHMENVIIENVQESASNEIPTIAVSVAAERVAWQQSNLVGTSRTSYGWDIVNNIEWLYAF